MKMLWEAIEVSGPGPQEATDAELWKYPSLKNEVVDAYAGLFGTILLIKEDSRPFDKGTLLRVVGLEELFIFFFRYR